MLAALRVTSGFERLDQTVDISLVVVALSRHPQQDEPRRVVGSRAGAARRPATDRDLDEMEDELEGGVHWW